MKIAKNEEKLEKRNRKLEDKYAALEQFNTMISQVVSTLELHFWDVWFGYILVNFMYRAEFQLAMGKQYSTNTDNMRQNGTVRRINDPHLILMDWSRYFKWLTLR